MAVQADATPVAPKAAGPSRALFGVTIALVALAVIAMVVVVLGDRAGSATYPAGSPEAAFQSYLQAFDDGDAEAAYAALSTRVRASWSYDQYLQDQDTFGKWQPERQVWIDSVERDGDRATLHLTVEYRSGSGLNISTWSNTQDVRMTLEDDDWRVDQRIVGLESL
jgi:hypothetical protein